MHARPRIAPRLALLLLVGAAETVGTRRAPGRTHVLASIPRCHRARGCGSREDSHACGTPALLSLDGPSDGALVWGRTTDGGRRARTAAPAPHTRAVRRGGGNDCHRHTLA